MSFSKLDQSFFQLNFSNSSFSVQNDFVTFIPAILFSSVAFTSPVFTLVFLVEKEKGKNSLGVKMLGDDDNTEAMAVMMVNLIDIDISSHLLSTYCMPGIAMSC